MSDDNDIRHGRHCVFLMHVHLVFVTKYRREVFTKEILDDLRNIFSSVCADFEAELVEFDGEDDHLHLLAILPRPEGRGLPRTGSSEHLKSSVPIGTASK